MGRVTPRAADAETDTRSPLADPSARLAAVALDAILPALPQLLLLPLGVVLRSATFIHASTWLGWALTGVLFVVDLVLLSRYGQSVGKRIMGLRIVRADGSRAALGRLFWLRLVLPSFIGFIPIVGWLFGLADTLTIFRADRRTIHDHMADTIVVDLRAPLGDPSLAEVFA